MQKLRSQKPDDLALGCDAENQSMQEPFCSYLCDLLAWIFLVIKIRDLGKGDTRG